MQQNELINLLSQKPENLPDALSQSRSIDLSLGLNKVEIEQSLVDTYKKNPTLQPWLGLPLHALETTYAEFVELVEEFSAPDSTQKWVDLGAAYGRLGVVLGLLRPQARFTGFEILPERTEEGQKALNALSLDPGSLKTQDLSASDFTLPAADFYFIYDFGTREAAERILVSIQEIAKQQKVVVFARGRGIRSWIDRSHPWLSQVVPPEHRPNLSIYRSA